MKNYIRPSVEVSKFDVADIITASGIVAAGADFAAGTKEAEMFAEYKAAEGVNDNIAVFQW